MSRAATSKIRLAECREEVSGVRLPREIVIASGRIIAQRDEGQADQSDRDDDKQGDLLGGADAAFAPDIEQIDGNDGSKSEEARCQQQVSKMAFGKSVVVS